MASPGPQNASIDDAPCMSCRNIVNKDSKAIQCDLCTSWIHIECAEITTKAYSTMQAMKGSLWLCEACQVTFTTIPKEVVALREENSALRLQLAELSDLPSMIKSLQQKLETLSDRLERREDIRGWTGQRKRNHSSPLSVAAHSQIEITNRFAPLTTYPVSNSPHPKPGPLANTPPPSCQTRPSRLSRDLPSESQNVLFYLRAIPRSIKLEQVKDKLATFGVPTNTLSYPPSLNPSSRRIYMTISLSRDDANKVSKGLKADHDLGWFISILPPKAPKTTMSSMAGIPSPPPYQPQTVHARTPTVVPPPGTHSQPQRQYPPQGPPRPPTFAQALARPHQRALHPHSHPQNVPDTPHRLPPPQCNPEITSTLFRQGTGNFRAAPPPLMSLILDHGTYGGGAWTPASS